MKPRGELNVSARPRLAAIALLMAVAGVYGVVSYAVAQRTREIGIRMSLGAEPRQVVGQVLREGMVLLGIGLALGLAGSWYATRLMGILLAGVSPHDPWAYAGVVLLLSQLSETVDVRALDMISSITAVLASA